MGYTHYWTVSKPFDDLDWGAALAMTKAIIGRAKKAGVEVAGWDGEGKPQVGAEKISFNGKADDSFETFTIERGVSEFEFCKTGHRDYDAVVVAVLMVLAGLPNSPLSWRSDGDSEEHEAGRKLANGFLIAEASK